MTDRYVCKITVFGKHDPYWTEDTKAIVDRSGIREFIFSASSNSGRPFSHWTFELNGNERDFGEALSVLEKGLREAELFAGLKLIPPYGELREAPTNALLAELNRRTGTATGEEVTFPEYMYVGMWNFTDEENVDWNELGVTSAFRTRERAMQRLIDSTWDTVMEAAEANDYVDDAAHTWANEFYDRVKADLLIEDDWPVSHSEEFGTKHCHFEMRKIRLALDNEN